MQGINDLVTPFLAVFLSEHLTGSMDGWDLDTVPTERMLEVRRRGLDCVMLSPKSLSYTLLAATVPHQGKRGSQLPGAVTTAAKESLLMLHAPFCRMS